MGGRDVAILDFLGMHHLSDRIALKHALIISRVVMIGPGRILGSSANLQPSLVPYAGDPR